MITKVKKDEQKAKSLRAMAEITLQRLKKTDWHNYPSNTLNDYYDIIHKLMEAISFLNGIKSSGEGAHQELIDYIAKEFSLGEKSRVFLQKMRDYRNRIAYEGFMVRKEYIEENKNHIEEIIVKLEEILEKQK
jgi:hypothetical protein